MSKPLEELGASDLRRVVTTFRDALHDHVEELNALNVYPVPDGDTGTNMALTLDSVCVELTNAETMAEVCNGMAHGSLMGARGNSGVILSQLLRGIADTCRDASGVDAERLAEGLGLAADAAYEAVLRPVEGTILTVARESAEAAKATAGDGLLGMLVATDTAARESVQRTPELLPVLAQAGVVDAGGHGFTLLLASFLHVVDGRPIPEPTVVAKPAAVTAHEEHEEGSDLRYEVMYLLDASDENIPAFKETWAALGDSIVVVGGNGIWNCHVHTNDIGAAVEAGIEAGRPNKIRVTDLLEQVNELEEADWVREHAAGAEEPEVLERVPTAIVAVAVGEGLGRMLTGLGVRRVVAGGQSMNPSTAQILEAVEAANAEGVIVLPNNKNIIPVAEQVDELADLPVAVVPTKSVVEGLAALISFDPNANVETNLGAMTEAAQRVRTGEVTQAVRDAESDHCGTIALGDWIALTRDGIRAKGPNASEAVLALVDALVDEDSELVTVLLGSDANPSDLVLLEEHLLYAHPHVEVEVHEGGQPLYPYLIGVE